MNRLTLPSIKSDIFVELLMGEPFLTIYKENGEFLNPNIGQL